MVYISDTKVLASSDEENSAANKRSHTWVVQLPAVVVIVLFFNLGLS